MVHHPDTPDRQRERPAAKIVLARGLFGCKLSELKPDDTQSAEGRSIFPLLDTQRAM